MKRYQGATVASAVAHGLAWVAFLWLTFWPYSYQGVSVTPVVPGDTPGEPRHISASLIQTNGLKVLPLLVFPVLLSGLGLLTVIVWGIKSFTSRALLSVAAILLILFGLAGAFSIGLFFLPAAVTMIVAAVMAFRQKTAPI